MPLNENAINEILQFAAEGLEASGDVLSLEDYKSHEMRLRGHRAGLALRELQNIVNRQTSHMATGLAQFIANRYAPGVVDDADLDKVEAGAAGAVTAEVAQYGVPFYSATVNYRKNALAIGLDGILYQALQASGPTTNGGAQPTSNATCWQRISYAAATTDLLNTLVLRDAAGRAQIANPSAAADIVPKGFLDTQLAGKVDTSSFTQSFGQGGWQKFPSGLIMQWGRVPSQERANTIVTFPVSFPSECMQVVAVGMQASGNAQAYVTINSYGPSGATFNCFYSASGVVPALATAAAVQVWYLALGR